MAVVSDGLYGRLAAATALTTLIGSRIFPAFVPQGTATPYVVFLRTDEIEDEAMTANSDVLQTEFDVLSIGATYAEAEGVHEAVRNACRRFQGTVGGVEIADMLLRGGDGPIYNDDPPLYEATQRVAVRYRRL